jgi:hypothetical protein
MSDDTYTARMLLHNVLDAQGVTITLNAAHATAIENCLAVGVFPEEISWAARDLASPHIDNPAAYLLKKLRVLADLPECDRILHPTPSPPNYHGQNPWGDIPAVPPTDAYLQARARLGHRVSA